MVSALIDGVEDQTCTASQNGCTGPNWNIIIPTLLASFATLQRLHHREQNRQSSDKVSTESSSSNSSPPVSVVQNKQSNIVAQKQSTKKVSSSSEQPTASASATKSPKRKTVYDEVERSDRSADGSLRNSPKRIKIGHENNNTATTTKKLQVVAENNSTDGSLSKDYPSK